MNFLESFLQFFILSLILPLFTRFFHRFLAVRLSDFFSRSIPCPVSAMPLFARPSFFSFRLRRPSSPLVARFSHLSSVGSLSLSVFRAYFSAAAPSFLLDSRFRTFGLRLPLAPLSPLPPLPLSLRPLPLAPLPPRPLALFSPLTSFLPFFSPLRALILYPSPYAPPHKTSAPPPRSSRKIALRLP